MRAFASVCLCVCVVEYMYDVCTQTISMIKKTETKKIQYTNLACIHTHRWWWWLNRLWMAKMTTFTNSFFPVAYRRANVCVYASASIALYLCDYFDIHLSLFFRFVSFSVSLFLILFYFPHISLRVLFFPYLFSAH